MKNQNFAFLSLFLTIVLAFIPWAFPEMDNHIFVLGFRIALILAGAATLALLVRHFTLPNETPPNSGIEENAEKQRGHVVIGANASNGGQIAVSDGPITQVNQQPAPIVNIGQEVDWKERPDGKYAKLVNLNIENSYACKGILFEVSQIDIDSIFLVLHGMNRVGNGGGQSVVANEPNRLVGIELIAEESEITRAPHIESTIIQ